MKTEYYEAIDKMQKSGAEREYINGWVGGYRHFPKREEQRVTEAYEAGYEDGSANKTDGYSKWVKK